MSYSRFRLTDLSTTDNVKLLSTHPSLAYLTPIHPAPRAKAPRFINDCTNPQSEEQQTTTHLLTLTTTLLTLLYNQKDYTHPFLSTHLLPTAIPRRHAQPFATTATSIASRAPHLHASILRSVAVVSGNGHRAEVWTWMRVGGLPVAEAKFKAASGANGGEGVRVEGRGIVKESVVVLGWERTGEEWVCTRLRVVRGVCGV